MSRHNNTPRRAVPSLAEFALWFGFLLVLALLVGVAKRGVP